MAYSIAVSESNWKYQISNFQLFFQGEKKKAHSINFFIFYNTNKYKPDFLTNIYGIFQYIKVKFSLVRSSLLSYYHYYMLKFIHNELVYQHPQDDTECPSLSLYISLQDWGVKLHLLRTGNSFSFGLGCIQWGCYLNWG